MNEKFWNAMMPGKKTHGKLEGSPREGRVGPIGGDQGQVLSHRTLSPSLLTNLGMAGIAGLSLLMEPD